MENQKVLDVLKRAICHGEVAGGALLVYQNGKEELYCEAGMADVEGGRAYQRDTIVRLFSATKPITAVAAMILVERGLLDPGAWLSDYLPEFSNMTAVVDGKVESCSKPILVKDVFNMTSGLAYGGDMSNAGSAAVTKVFEDLVDQLYTENKMTTDEVIKRLAECPLAFVPGSQWMYGTSADIMGVVIERITGERFSDFLRKEIFEPLGMKDTAFYVPEEKMSRLAKVYETNWDAVNEQKAVDPQMKNCEAVEETVKMTELLMREYHTDNLGIRYTQDVAPAFESGGAGLVSTIDDYMKFAQMLLNGGSYQGKQILSKRMVQFLTEARLMPWQQESMNRSWDSLDGYTYSNFLRIMEEPEKATMLSTKGEYGWDGWLGFYFINSPKDNLTMLFSCQKRDAGTMPLTRKLKNVVWNELC